MGFLISITLALSVIVSVSSASQLDALTFMKGAFPDREIQSIGKKRASRSLNFEKEKEALSAELAYLRSARSSADQIALLKTLNSLRYSRENRQQMSVLATVKLFQHFEVMGESAKDNFREFLYKKTTRHMNVYERNEAYLRALEDMGISAWPLLEPSVANAVNADEQGAMETLVAGLWLANAYEKDIDELIKLAESKDGKSFVNKNPRGFVAAERFFGRFLFTLRARDGSATVCIYKPGEMCHRWSHAQQKTINELNTAVVNANASIVAKKEAAAERAANAAVAFDEAKKTALKLGDSNSVVMCHSDVNSGDEYSQQNIQTVVIDLYANLQALPEGMSGEFNPPGKGEFEKTVDYEARIAGLRARHESSLNKARQKAQANLNARGPYLAKELSARITRIPVQNITYDADAELFEGEILVGSPAQTLPVRLSNVPGDPRTEKPLLQKAKPCFVYVYQPEEEALAYKDTVLIQDTGPKESLRVYEVDKLDVPEGLGRIDVSLATIARIEREQATAHKQAEAERERNAKLAAARARETKKELKARLEALMKSGKAMPGAALCSSPHYAKQAQNIYDSFPANQKYIAEAQLEKMDCAIVPPGSEGLPLIDASNVGNGLVRFTLITGTVVFTNAGNIVPQ